MKKPEVKTIRYLDLLEVIEYLKELGHENAHDILWDHANDTCSGFGNDSYFKMRRVRPCSYTQEIEDLTDVIWREFNIGDEEPVTFWVSW